MRTTLALGLTLSALAGCTTLLGIEPWDGGEGARGGASSAAGTGGGPGVGGGCADGVCVALPLSWKGPAALTVPGGGCGGGFAREIARGKTDLAGDPAHCGCTCEPAHGEVCSAATLEVFSDPTCAPGSGVSLSLGAACASGLSGPPLSARAIAVTAAAPSGGQCDPVPSIARPAPTFDERRLCEPRAAATCPSGGACAAIPGGRFLSRLCVWVEGRADACPGDFTERFDLLRGAVTDTRGCTACTCGPSNGSCVATATVYADGACASAKAAVASAQGCFALSTQGFGSASATYAVDAGSCEPSKVRPAGEVSAADPVTVCCTNAL